MLIEYAVSFLGLMKEAGSILHKNSKNGSVSMITVSPIREDAMLARRLNANLPDWRSQYSDHGHGGYDTSIPNFPKRSQVRNK